MDSNNTCGNCRFHDRATTECRRSFPRRSDAELNAVWFRTELTDWCGAWGATRKPKAPSLGSGGRPEKFPPEMILPILRATALGADNAKTLAELTRAVSVEFPVISSTLFNVLKRMVTAGAVAKVGETYYVAAHQPATLEVA